MGVGVVAREGPRGRYRGALGPQGPLLISTPSEGESGEKEEEEEEWRVGERCSLHLGPPTTKDGWGGVV
jgi:hypothetical protein